MTPVFDAKGKVAFVTGAAGGVGKAVAGLLSDAGAEVAGFDLEKPSGVSGSSLALIGDVTSEDDLRAAVSECERNYSHIDYVVHAAGAVGKGKLADTTLEDWRRLIDVNLTSAFLLARATYKHLCQTKGCAVLVSSPNGVHGGSHLSGPAYASAKAGIINLTRYLAKEWAPDRIRVNCVVPGAIDTPMFRRLDTSQQDQIIRDIPSGRLCQPEEVAQAIAYLCSSAAAYVTGTTLNITGGRLL